jgi:hypothetical protein
MPRMQSRGLTAVIEPGHLLAGATIFSGAFLLFALEPLIAKVILPWFGGSAQVWTICLVFFQAALLTGYYYAHQINSGASPRWQTRIHLTLLAASIAFLPIVPAASWKPAGGEDPTWLILGLLVSTIGLPFILLSSTGPLLQAWLTRAAGNGQQPPYRLFALSNFGSMLALLSYPLLVEPAFALRSQAYTWSALYVIFVVLTALSAWRYNSAAAAHDPARLIEILPSGSRLLWFLLSAVPSALLLAMTAYMLQNIAAIPLFWVVPLALYLLSFIFAFNNLRWFVLPNWYTAFAVALIALIMGMNGSSGLSDLALLPLFSAALFVFFVVCHSELALFRPGPQHLTQYYLIISAGGAAGGIFVAVVAPAVFDASHELRILLPATVLLVAIAASRHYRDWARTMRRGVLLASTGIVLALAIYAMASLTFRDLSDNLLLARNFYGAVRVQELPLIDGRPVRQFLSGRVTHGVQFTQPELRREPLTYYSHASGIGIALDELGKRGPLRVGVIGLGVGTMAAYARRGDSYRFYEINPLVETIARKYFWYLGMSPARTDIVLGDARLALEREAAQNFDLLAVDAFVSDSIPTHLLTREAFALYWRNLRPDGVLVVNISNDFANLAPIVAAAAMQNGKTARLIVSDDDRAHGVTKAEWVVVTSRMDLFALPSLRPGKVIPIPPDFRMWTDDYSNLWSALNF